MTEQKDIGGLWENTSARGVTYFSGSINGQKIVVFKNGRKQPGENSPDWRIYESTPRENRENTVRGPQRQASNVDPGDEIPF